MWLRGSRTGCNTLGSRCVQGRGQFYRLSCHGEPPEDKPNQVFVLDARNCSLRPCLWETYWFPEVQNVLAHLSTWCYQKCKGWTFCHFYGVEASEKKKIARLFLFSPHHEQHVMLDQDRPRLCLLWLPGSGPPCRGAVFQRFTISPAHSAGSPQSEKGPRSQTDGPGLT